MPKDPEGWELLYLSWGLRWMGDNPISSAMHDGWAYSVVLEGSPTILINGVSRKTKPGTVIIFHPDCAYGWTDRRGKSCRILTWLWRTPPSHSVLQPKPGDCLIIKVGKSVLSRLAAINKECSQAVAMPGEMALWVLRRARLDFDITLAAANQRRDPVDSRYRMNLAVQYLKHNPAELQPVKKLCEYLQVSPTTLRQLFLKHLNRSPQDFALEQRMRLADRLLHSKRCSVKEVAFRLGYRHANDFSRAYKRFSGRLANAGRSAQK